MSDGVQDSLSPKGYVASSGPKSDKISPAILGLKGGVTLRTPEVFVLLSEDNEEKGKSYPGTVGFKYGPEKGEWVRVSYLTMKKIIDLCQENKILFNAQLKKELEKNQVSLL